MLFILEQIEYKLSQPKFEPGLLISFFIMLRPLVTLDWGTVKIVTRQISCFIKCSTEISEELNFINYCWLEELYLK